MLAEHRFAGRALVWTLDGTGLGEDGTLWGGELLFVDTREGPEHRRLAHFAPMELPGGEAAIREPWRIAHALLLRLGLLRDGAAGDFPLPWTPEYKSTADLLPTIVARRINTPTSTSCGRLFDAVAALLGLCNATTYEGQAAIRLEEAGNVAGLAAKAACSKGALYSCGFAPGADGCLQLDSHALFRAVYEDRARGTDVPLIALRFHHSLAEGLAELAAHEAGRLGIRHVGLSGGCMQNVTLTLALAEALEQRGLIPLPHRNLPPGDGGISLGQAAWGRMLLRARGRESERN